MKTTFLIIGILLVLGLLGVLYRKYSAAPLETYEYTVIKKYDDFETRSYDVTLFTSVTLAPTTFKEASRNGFKQLAGYIFGGNETKEKIAMTTPVSMSLEDSMTMMFMVPKQFNKNTLPQPMNKNIDFVTVPKKTVAAIRFGGWANDEKLKDKKQQLISFLKKEGISHSNHFYFLGYNAPFELINRRNEIIVELINK